MNAKPDVSIIIPCYNSAKYLAETIDCVKSQIYNSWECIIINDGSKDETEQIALSEIDGDDRFKYLFQENGGVCVARNSAAIHANGDFLLFLDADDLISNNFLEETVKVMLTDKEINVVTSPVKFFGRSKGVLNVVSYDLATLLAENQMVITCLLRHYDFKRIGGFNVNMKEGFEDWDFWISLLKNGGKVKCADKAMFYYRLQNVSRNNQISIDKEKKLRYQMWLNHKELFSLHFFDPTLTFEYKKFANSPEYKIGKIILTPVRIIKRYLGI